jgi:hypothetical protein
LKLTTANTFNDEAKNSYNVIKSEIEAKENTINLLEVHMKEQEGEIDKFTSERPQFITLIQKSHQALSLSESYNDRLVAEVNDLKSRLKVAPTTASKMANIFSQGNLLTISLPFEGELLDKCEEIMKFPQYQPIQKIQLILNEAAGRITEAEKELLEVRSIPVQPPVIQLKSPEKPPPPPPPPEPPTASSSPFGEILIALLNELKAIAGFDTHSDFVSFVASKC